MPPLTSTVMFSPVLRHAALQANISLTQSVESRQQQPKQRGIDPF
jgi:hypothetical protein